LGNWTFSKAEKLPEGRKRSFFFYFHIESKTNEETVNTLPIDQCSRTVVSMHCSYLGSVRYAFNKAYIKPILMKVFPKSWSEETVKRLGRNWYYDVHDLTYGISLTESSLHIVKRTNDMGSLDKTTIYDYPWTLDYVNRIDYNANTNEPLTFVKGSPTHDQVNRQHFLIQDYDGEYLVTSAYKEQLIYYRCKGILKPFRYLLPKKSFWLTDLWFSKETGGEKGSWKGGTIGSSERTNKKESIEDSVLRYCEKHGMKMIGSLGYSVGHLTDEEITRLVSEHYPTYVNLLNPQKPEV